MFSLRAAAGRFQEDVFHPWNATLSEFDLSPGAEIIGRVFRIDRFTTIYHRPTRRRQITFPPGVILPTSNIVKHKVTGDIYILSATDRAEVIHGKVYDRIVSGHLATAPSGGLGILYHPTIDGPPDNPGEAHLVLKDTGYCDIELRSTHTADMVEGDEIGQYIITLPSSCEVVDGDWLFVHDSYYKVIEPYFDSGFICARAINEPYDLETITYFFDFGYGGGYDAETGTVTPTVTASRELSAIVKVRKETQVATEIGEYWEGVIYIETDMISWNPTVNHSIAHNGIRYKILSVGIGKMKRQWELKVRQWQGFEPPVLGS